MSSVKPTKQQLEKVVNKLTDILSVKKELRKDLKVDYSLNIEPSCGLCFNTLNNLPSEYREKLFKKWKHFSGDTKYPVHTDLSCTAEEEFDACGSSKYTGKYGKYRFKLAKYMLKRIKKDLKKLEENIQDEI